jgi:gamma-glutamylcyclotransferase (GGCT)/AIG2-like uncharacterized protein YtfP
VTTRNVTVIVTPSPMNNDSLPRGSSTPHLFAYGSLADPSCLDEVLGHRHRGERLRARLDGFERMTTAVYPYPYIVAAHGRSVDGVLLMDLSSGDVEALDRYEEVDQGMYHRQSVEVEAWGCGPRTLHLQAHTYVAGPALIASIHR